jgi:hypothetical protein
VYQVAVASAGGGCTVTATGSITSAPPTCRADFNLSGAPDVQDIFDFLNAWFAGCP